jgi:anti-sigma-K factor RskA
MNCLYKNKRGTEILLDYCIGTLAPERAEAVEKHALECGDCRALIAAQQNLWNALDQLEAPEVSADFDARLYARIAREDADSAWRTSWKASLGRWWRGFAPGGVSWRPLVAGAAATAVVAVGLSLSMPMLHAPKAPDSPVQIRPESINAEQVEVTIEDLELLMPPAASAGRM